MARVLHLSEFTKGGIETHLNEVLGYQSSVHDVYLMVSEQNSSRETLCISPERLIVYPYKRKPVHMLKAMKAMARVMKELEPDIVHVHGTFAGLFARGMHLFRRKRPAIVYCAHGWSFLMDTSPWKKRLYALAERILENRSDAIIHISRHEYRMALAYGLSARKSVVVYNGVSERKPSDVEHSPIETIPSCLNLLYIGRFDRQKGFDRLLDLFRQHDFPNVKLYLIGDTVLKAQTYDFPDNAVRLGWVDNAEIDRYICACDAVIVPSRWEGFGIVAVEALRNGKPVIASRRGALPEIVEHDVNGYLFDFDDTEQLAAIIRGMDKNRLEEMGRAGRDIFHRKFHADGMNGRIESLYRDVLTGRRGRHASAEGKYV